MLNKRSIGKILLSVFVISSLLITGDSIVNAAKKRSSKRASSTSNKKKTSSKKSGSKRSASSKSSKRAASTNSRRAASTNSRRAARTNSRRAAAAARRISGATTSTASTSKRSSGNQCPVGRVVRYASDEQTYYYARKKTCTAPENAHEESWDSSSNLKKMAWIEASEAVYFTCDENFTKKGTACIDAYGICPLDTALEKSGKDYINPNTDEACSAPEKSILSKLTDEEAENAGYDSAYKFSCPENYYSSELTAGYIAQCNECPDGYTAPAGSTSKDACVNPLDKVSCDAGNGYVDGTCTPCAAGTFSLGGKTQCNTCLATGVATCDATNGKALTCKTGYYMSDGNCVAEKSCGTGAATCDKSTGKATKCNGGYKLLSNGTCEICPAGTYARAGSQVCSPCNDYYWSNPGSASCGRIQIKITYSHWNNDNEAGRTCAASKQQWFNAGTTVQCNNATFGDPAVGRGKGCGAECAHLSSEGQTIELGSCRKLPCDIYGRSGDRTIKLNADGTADGKGSGWSNTYSRVSSNMVRW